VEQADELARAAALLSAVGPLLPALATPALLVDLDAVDRNIAAVVARAGADRWRPHVKTLKSAALVRRLWAAGVARSKCATLDELDLLLRTAAADDREDSLDVLLAYPLHEAAFHAAERLRAAHPRARVQYLADAPEHAAALSRWAAAPIEVHLDIDLGMARTGAPPAAWTAAVRELTRLPRVQIAGLHGYDGHLRWDQRREAAAAHDALCDLAELLRRHGGMNPAPLEFEIVTSGTHSFDAALAHPRLVSGPWRHRISPGTVVLSDLHSEPAAGELGLTPAALVLTRVVSLGTGRVTLDAGSKAISPDRPPPSCRPLGWPGLTPLRASEEHLPLRHDHGPQPGRGEPLLLLPDHVCTTVNMYRECLLLRRDRPPERATIGAQGHRLFLSEGT
jgi:D-serine deaminase-like pyridoxal phosphate-dependent protein